MGVMRMQPITGPAAWRGREIEGDPSWAARLSPGAIGVIDAAVAAVQARGLAFPAFGAADFPIDAALAGMLRGIAEELENGRGFLLLRGLPVQRWTDEQIRIACYGLGLHLGRPVRQNPRGDLLGLVAHVGDATKKTTRVFETNLYLPYHSDLSDVVGLLCVRRAKAGGLSSLVGVAAVHNEILAGHREYLGLFYKPWWFAHLGDDAPTPSPIFSDHQGRLACRYLRQYVELGHELQGQPLSRIEREALDLFDALIQREDLRLDMMLEPGDLQFANNYAVLHSRTEFEDHAAPELRRRMYRLWLKMPNARALAPEFPGRNGFPHPVAEPAAAAPAS